MACKHLCFTSALIHTHCHKYTYIYLFGSTLAFHYRHKYSAHNLDARPTGALVCIELQAHFVLNRVNKSNSNSQLSWAQPNWSCAAFHTSFSSQLLKQLWRCGSSVASMARDFSKLFVCIYDKQVLANK